MSWGLHRGEWRVSDVFGDDWRIRVRALPAAEGGDAGSGGSQPGEAPGAESDPRVQIDRLVFDAFTPSGATDDRAAAPLLEIFDALTNGDLAARLPVPTVDPDRLLAGMDLEILRTLLGAFATGALEIDPIVRPTWTMPAPPPSDRTADAGPMSDHTTYFVLRVVDEVGASVDGISVVFTADGSDRTMTTDGAGMARLDGMETSNASVRLGSIAAVRDKLKPRWADPRAPSIPAGDGVVVREVGDDALDSIALQGAVLTTLVLTPYFQCHEIPGAHFEFGRSFVRSDALDVLAPIAEALTGDAGRKGIVFGHTDLSGPEALNKELSERRAKALYALLTQDADAWEELYSGSADGPSWQEKWDLEEIQHMLNALGVTDDAGGTLQEDGVRGELTTQAVRRFQSGSYPDCPAEQAPLETDGDPGKKTRHELFLAYAKRISRKPVDPARLTKLGDAKFMGCGEFNPMSLTVKDAESRRAVIFVYDPAAEPQKLPCKLRSLSPCHSNCGPLPTAPDPDGKPPYRCKIYQAIAKKCPCQGGPDLSHDFRVTLLMTLDQANQLPDVLVLESDDATVTQRLGASSDAHANADGLAELDFTSLPEIHSYRLRVEGVDDPYTVFDYTPFDQLSLLGAPADAADALPDDFYADDDDGDEEDDDEDEDEDDDSDASESGDDDGGDEQDGDAGSPDSGADSSGGAAMASPPAGLNRNRSCMPPRASGDGGDGPSDAGSDSGSDADSSAGGDGASEGDDASAPGAADAARASSGDDAP